jgi:hypothetical protein
MTLWQLPSTLVQIKYLREGNYLEDMTYLSVNGVCVCLDCRIVLLKQHNSREGECIWTSITIIICIGLLNYEV